jgi:DNA replication protein DnaC
LAWRVSNLATAFGEGSLSPLDTQRIDDWLYQATTVNILVLDDLGSEPITKRDEKSTPLAAGILADVIRKRNHDACPIWWTSNAGSRLKNLYEPALVSRLLESAPMLKVPKDVPNYRLLSATPER